MPVLSMFRLYLTIVPICLVILFGGCSRGVAWLDKRDQELPLVQKAASRASEGDIDSAIRLYQKALEQSPDAARAHLDLAFLLDEHRKDYVDAIYHFRRYLELRPDAEKKSLVEERVRMAEQHFAAEILGPSRLADKATVLERENAVLKSQLATLSQRMTERPRPQGAAAAPTVRGSEPVIRSTRIAGRGTTVSTYQVRRGDTLTSIASQVYGDGNRWKEIQLSNSDILGNSSQVKVGQVLVIPQ